MRSPGSSCASVVRLLVGALLASALLVNGAAASDGAVGAPCRFAAVHRVRLGNGSRIGGDVRANAAGGEVRLGRSASLVDTTTSSTTTTTTISGPAALRLDLERDVVTAGLAVAFVARVTDANGAPVLPEPAIDYTVSAAGGTAGATPVVSPDEIGTAATTRGTWQIQGTVQGTAISATHRFVVIANPPGDTQEDLLSALSARFNAVAAILRDLRIALEVGDEGSIQALRDTLVAERNAVDLAAYARTIPFAPEAGFPPTSRS